MASQEPLSPAERQIVNILNSGGKRTPAYLSERMTTGGRKITPSEVTKVLEGLADKRHVYFENGEASKK